MQSGADSSDTVATWWQEVSTLGSPLKNQPGLKVRQVGTTNILLPNTEKVQIHFILLSNPNGVAWLGSPKITQLFLKFNSLLNALGFKALNLILRELGPKMD